jgi:hypothetical protein
MGFSSYESALGPARTAFASSPSLTAMLDENVDPITLELFLIHFCSLGVGMTEPVDGWIRRAGERCRAIGLEALGVSLGKHAQHEAGHHLMMIEDTRKLVARWNDRHAEKLDAEALLARPLPAGVISYRELHEAVISGARPYGQLAIEYEIERLSVAHGGDLLRRCAARLGKEILAGLSFLEEHVAVDVGHTKFNAAELGRLLGEHPDFLDGLVESGSSALSCYAAFLDDCLAGAKQLRPRPRS